MLRLTIVSPSEITKVVVGYLANEPGCAHLTANYGASVKPSGDVVTADIAREAANEILDDLVEMGLRSDGAITISSLDTVISKSAHEAVSQSAGDPIDATVWRELTSEVKEESTLNVTFVAFMTLSLLLAAAGVVTDSPVTIVGAMVVGPEFGPLAGIAVALVRRQWSLVGSSAIALLIGYPIAMAITWCGVKVAESAGWITLGMLHSNKSVDFVYQVGPFSLIIALLAGCAGMLAMMTAKSTVLIGVFISVTTAPAAGYAVIAATVGEWRIAGESSVQLAINLLGIVVAASAVLLCRPGTWRKHHGRLYRRRISPSMTQLHQPRTTR